MGFSPAIGCINQKLLCIASKFKKEAPFVPLLETSGRLAPTDVTYELNNFTRTIELVWLHILNVLFHLVFPINNLPKVKKDVKTFLKESAFKRY
jgi:hypothetical protein